MKRTHDTAAMDTKDFKAKLKEAISAGLDAFAKADVTHAVLAGIGTGIYANPSWPRGTAQKLLHEAIAESLKEEVGPNNESRGQYFKQVVFPELEKLNPRP